MDVSTLAQSPLLATFDAQDVARIVPYLENVELPKGTVAVREGDDADAMYFICDGQAHMSRGAVDLGLHGPGDYFGDIGLLARRRRAASVEAATHLTLAKLSLAKWEQMCEQEPALALRFVRAIINRLGVQLAEMTDSVGLLLRERSLPRRTTVNVRTATGMTTTVRTGTHVQALLPSEVDGSLVVAALLDQRAVSLHTPIASDATIAPLTTAHWEGAQIFRRSVGLLLLEAAAEIAPMRTTRLGPSMGVAKYVEIQDAQDVDLGDFAGALVAEMQRLVARDVIFREEIWTIEEARTHFELQGWHDAVELLEGWREATVPMVSCGRVYALSVGPHVPSAGLVRGFALRPQNGGLLLHYGDAGPLEPVATVSPISQRAPYSGDEAMMREHQRWLGSLGVTSIGAFNRACVEGEVTQIIRVAEGFHEKEIGEVADEIATRAGKVRVICIAGPSSSGKTTFIKRLKVQLQVNGITPVPISLDDYYVDRERTPRDSKGELDFEALEALDLELLHEQVGRLMKNERVKIAKYDFAQGKSFAKGGREIQLGPRDLLMLEGIHGLNPKLLEPDSERDRVFRVFIHPMTSLPYDRLSHVDLSDIRLLRRIVRDRHTRGANAADNIMRWPSVRHGERAHIFPFIGEADVVFDSSLVYELSILKVFAERYLLEVPQTHAAYATAHRLRRLIDRFVAIYPDHVPPTSIIREFIGGSGFEY